MGRCSVDRRALIVFLGAGCGLATGCGDFDDADRNKFFDRVRLDVQGIRNALDKLKGNMKDFDTEDWRDVVAELNDNVSELDKAISDVETDVNPAPPL